MNPISTFGWNGHPFPRHAERLVLPGGYTLPDAIIWRGFLPNAVEMDPHHMLKDFLEYPEHPIERPFQFNEHGDHPCWVTGENEALSYRGKRLPRGKMFVQDGFQAGLSYYGYPGRQHRISYAMNDIRHVPAANQFLQKLNAGLVRSGHSPHNNVIITRYLGQDDNIGYHHDKEASFEPGSFFVVVKLGAERDFGFCLAGQKKPFYVCRLDAGDAVFVRCNAHGAANRLVKHGVPRMKDAVGLSGSIVTRCIREVRPWERVHADVRRSEQARVARKARKAQSRAA